MLSIALLRIEGFNYEEQRQHPAHPKPCWKRASQDQKDSFKINVEQKLESIYLSNETSNCNDVKCKGQNHCMDVDNFMVDILDCVETASFESLPVMKTKTTQG